MSADAIQDSYTLDIRIMRWGQSNRKTKTMIGYGIGVIGIEYTVSYLSMRCYNVITTLLLLKAGLKEICKMQALKYGLARVTRTKVRVD